MEPAIPWSVRQTLRRPNPTNHGRMRITNERILGNDQYTAVHGVQCAALIKSSGGCASPKTVPEAADAKIPESSCGSDKYAYILHAKKVRIPLCYESNVTL